MVKRSSGPISRGPGGDRVAVKVGVVQMGRVNDKRRSGGIIHDTGVETEIEKDMTITDWRLENE